MYEIVCNIIIYIPHIIPNAFSCSMRHLHDIYMTLPGSGHPIRHRDFAGNRRFRVPPYSRTRSSAIR